ncbi:uncharacterized protein LOC119378973 [Rhipicephalus sanguineus]|uniref:uncharacterized protein LOC119378973 n=1 Tax=Rhipicephalus sanguineus TaxID=34632 RepID=UPI001894C45F|nr:uncharacterized protein LOC119378973 [Rhipicephalus sanguineus]
MFTSGSLAAIAAGLVPTDGDRDDDDDAGHHLTLSQRPRYTVGPRQRRRAHHVASPARCRTHAVLRKRAAARRVALGNVRSCVCSLSCEILSSFSGNPMGTYKGAVLPLLLKPCAESLVFEEFPALHSLTFRGSFSRTRWLYRNATLTGVYEKQFTRRHVRCVYEFATEDGELP